MQIKASRYLHAKLLLQKCVFSNREDFKKQKQKNRREVQILFSTWSLIRSLYLKDRSYLDAFMRGFVGSGPQLTCSGERAKDHPFPMHLDPSSAPILRISTYGE